MFGKTSTMVSIMMSSSCITSQLECLTELGDSLVSLMLQGRKAALGLYKLCKVMEHVKYRWCKAYGAFLICKKVSDKFCYTTDLNRYRKKLNERS